MSLVANASTHFVCSRVWLANVGAKSSVSPYRLIRARGGSEPLTGDIWKNDFGNGASRNCTAYELDVSHSSERRCFRV